MIENSCITGFVYVRNSTYGEGPAIKVTAMGPYGSMTTSTNKNGEFWFRNVGNGTYELECSFTGYGSIRIYGVQVFGNDTARVSFSEIIELPAKNLRLPELISVSLDQQDITVNNNGTDCSGDPTAVRFFLSTDSKVSYENFQYTTLTTLGYYCQMQFYTDLLNSFESGEKIYLVGYITGNEDIGYMDMRRGIQVFSTLNEESRSNVISFIMP